MSLSIQEATELIRDAQADRAAALDQVAEAQRRATGDDQIIQGCLILYPELADDLGEQANLPGKAIRLNRHRTRKAES